MPIFSTMQSMEFNPTAEQTAIIDAAHTGENVVVTAVAGSGKTSTLKLIGNALAPKRGLYLAFGKDIQTEAEKSFPANVECRTAHSVAYAYGMQKFPGLMRKMKRDVKPWDAPKTMGLPYNGQTFSDGEEQRNMSARALAAHVNATITKFCHTAEREVQGWMVPREFVNNTDQGIFARFILPFAQKAWADITSENGKLKFSFDHYLKLWSLDCPKLNADFILFDEAQDADPAISHVVENQSVQVIMVGDASQAIYGWRGAVDALSKFQAPHRLTLTQSFRFGPAIADFANRFLNLLDAEVRVTGFDAKDSKVGPVADADAILCRTNAGVIEYAIDLLAKGKRVAIAGGVDEMVKFFKAAEKLQAIEGGARGFVTHPDLAGFDTWTDVVEHANSEDGSDIRIKVKLVQEYGVKYLLDVLSKLVDIKKAAPGTYDVVISTAHKAKGLEWDSVQIAADFKAPAEDGGTLSDPELMLLYVAVTRAKLNLDATVLSWLDSIV